MGSRTGGKNRRLPLIIGVGALALVLIIGATLAIRSGVAEPVSGPLPSSTVSGWDDSSPIPSPSPTPTPSPSATPEDSPDASEVACPQGDPADVASAPSEDRVRGGNLSFEKVDGYSAPGPKYGLSWFYDVGSQSQRTEPGWESWFAVGEVAAVDQFATPRQAALSSMQCVVNEGFFSNYSGRTDLRNEAITIDGNKGWITQAEIRVDNSTISVEGDVVTFIFVDDGRDDRMSGYCGIVPIDDKPRAEIAEAVQASLRVG